MKGLIILANGFEDTEAITTIDVLKRSGIEMTTATPNEDLVVTTQYQHQLLAQVSLNELNSQDYDFLVIPGGGAVSKVLSKLKILPSIIKEFVQAKKLVAAICAAPSLLGKNGFLKGLDYTCFPGYESDTYGGRLLSQGVVVTDKIITAKSMYYTIEFALAIIEKLQGETQKQKVLKSLKGE
jgi:4-methyl-5(b-hydroxyethyl)-thiazole monophosphate biosynthesis